MSNAIKLNKNFGNTCRTCLLKRPKSKLYSLFKNSLNKQLSELANIKLNEHPELPTHICTQCLSSLRAATKFKKKVYDAEFKLNDILLEVDLTRSENKDYQKDSDSEHGSNQNDSGDDFENYETDWKDQNAQSKDCSASEQLPHKNGSEDKAKFVEENKEDAKKESSNIKMHKCPECSKLFKYDSSLKAHCVKHGNLLHCEPCNSSFRSLRVYEKHLKQHPDYKPFLCLFCDKKFSVVSTLKKHHRLHDCENRFLCKICGKSFVHGFVLKSHLRTHTGEKPYKCDICNATYTTSSFLVIHKRTHTMERPYKCNTCFKTFISKCALRAHSSTHSNEKKFICNVCGKGASRLPDLATHMRFHTGEKPYSCDQCSKRFTTSSNLAAHRKIHLGVKEHVCEVCSKAFLNSQTLKRHFRIHTGEKPYECKVCGKRYTQSGQLSVHRRSHTTKEKVEPSVY